MCILTSSVLGAAVSGAFLFIIGLANCFILWRIIRQHRLAAKQRARRIADGENQAADDIDMFDGGNHNNMLMMRILGPIIHFVDRPWKVRYSQIFYANGRTTS